MSHEFPMETIDNLQNQNPPSKTCLEHYAHRKIQIWKLVISVLVFAQIVFITVDNHWMARECESNTACTANHPEVAIGLWHICAKGGGCSSYGPMSVAQQEVPDFITWIRSIQVVSCVFILFSVVLQVWSLDNTFKPTNIQFSSNCLLVADIFLSIAGILTIIGSGWFGLKLSSSVDNEMNEILIDGLKLCESMNCLIGFDLILGWVFGTILVLLSFLFIGCTHKIYLNEIGMANYHGNSGNQNFENRGHFVVDQIPRNRNPKIIEASVYEAEQPNYYTHHLPTGRNFAYFDESRPKFESRPQRSTYKVAAGNSCHTSESTLNEMKRTLFLLN